MKFWANCWNQGVKLIIGCNHGLARCEAEWQWDLDGFKDYDLWIVLDGKGKILINGMHHDISPGFAICFPPGTRDIHARHDPEKPLQVFFCHFSLQGAVAGELPVPASSDPVLMSHDQLSRSAVQSLAGLLDTNSQVELQQVLLWQLLLSYERCIGRGASDPDERIQALIRQIREVPSASYSVDSLAMEAGLSTGHFRRIFHRLTGQSPVQYILQCRIERACYFLTETRLQIHEIASATGYADVYFFSRQFKERTGMSPSSYRYTK